MTDRRLSRPLVWTILALAVMVAMGWLLTCDFTWWDDPTTVHSNWRFDPVRWDTVVFYWCHPSEDIYIPLTRTVWMLVSMAARVSANPDGIKFNPVFFHALNVSTHVAGAFAVFALLRRLVSHDLAALLGAALWAVHPVQVESVGWVSGYKDVLCGALSVMAIERYVAWRQGPTRGRYGVSFLLYALAMLAKPSAMTLPLILAAIDWLALHRRPRETLKALWPFALAAVPVVLIARLSQTALMVDSPLWARPLIAADSLAFYVIKIIFPVHLAIDYGRTPTSVIGNGRIWFTWLLPAAIAAAAVWRYRRARLGNRPIDFLPVLGGVIFVLAPLHVLGFTRFDFQVYSTVADHYLYVAMLGPALCLAWAIARGPRSFFACAAAVVAVYAGRAAAQCPVWENEAVLMAHTLRINPRSWLALNNIAADDTRRGNLPAAADALKLATEYSPHNPILQLSWATHYVMAGDYPLAAQYFHQMLDEHVAKFGRTPDRIIIYHKAIELFLDALQLDEAEKFIREGLVEFPNNATMLYHQERIANMRRDPAFQLRLKAATTADTTADTATDTTAETTTGPAR